MLCPHCGARNRAARGRCAACGARLTNDTALPANVVLVVRSGSPLRDRAGSPAGLLQTLGRGETLELLGSEGGFLRVRAESGAEGFIDAVNVRRSEQELAAAQEVAPAPPPAQEELPFGLNYAPGERLLFYGDFLYDPFEDRALVITSLRVIIAGGGSGSLPRVIEVADLSAAGLREGSTGVAIGERTLWLEAVTTAGHTYISGLRDPERAHLAIIAARAGPPQTAGDPSPATAESPASGAGVPEQLAALWELVQSGALGRDEYNREKRRLLKSAGG